MLRFSPCRETLKVKIESGKKPAHKIITILHEYRTRKVGAERSPGEIDHFEFL